MKFKQYDGYLAERQAETLTACLAALDYCLTGKRPQGHQPEHDLVKFLTGSELFYLSDGGYSRVCVVYHPREKPLLFLADATEKVRENWRELNFMVNCIQYLMWNIIKTIRMEEG